MRLTVRSWRPEPVQHALGLNKLRVGQQGRQQLQLVLRNALHTVRSTASVPKTKAENEIVQQKPEKLIFILLPLNPPQSS